MRYFECYGRFHSGWHQPYATHPRVYSKLFKFTSGAYVRNHGPPSKCAKGIIALESYKKQWNDRHGCWSSQPLHNFASHGADAFRILSVGIGKLVNKGLSAEEWRSLRQQYVV